MSQNYSDGKIEAGLHGIYTLDVRGCDRVCCYRTPRRVRFLEGLKQVELVFLDNVKYIYVTSNY